MLCPRCKIGMEEEKRSFHKRRKWICPRCGRVKMQRVGARGERKSRRKDKSIE